MKRKIVTMILTLTMLASCLIGCGVEEKLDFYENYSADLTASLYLTPVEASQAGDNYSNGCDSVTVEDVVYTKTVNNGVTYYVNTQTEYLSQTELLLQTEVLRIDDTACVLQSDAEVIGTEFMKMTATFPQSVVKTNGTLGSDGKTVTWDYMRIGVGEKPYAIFNEQATIPDQTVTFTGISGKYSNKDVTLKAQTDGLVLDISVKTGTEETTEANSCDTVDLTDEGIYTVTATDINGKRTSCTAIIDKTKPTANVKSGKVYKQGKTVVVKDALSGVKNVTLDGKKVGTRMVVKKQGAHRLVIKDKAGNKSVIKFKIVP